MIKWTNHIISWHSFQSPFQVLIYLESNNLSRAFLEATSIFQIPPNSTRQILAQAQGVSEPHVKAFLTCQAVPLAIFSAHSTLPPNSQAASCLRSWVLAQSHLPGRPPNHCSPVPHSTCWVRSPCVLCIGLQSPTLRTINTILFVLFLSPTPTILNVLCPLILLSMPQRQQRCPTN